MPENTSGSRPSASAEGWWVSWWRPSGSEAIRTRNTVVSSVGRQGTRAARPSCGGMEPREPVKVDRRRSRRQGPHAMFDEAPPPVHRRPVPLRALFDARGPPDFVGRRHPGQRPGTPARTGIGSPPSPPLLLLEVRRLQGVDNGITKSTCGGGDLITSGSSLCVRLDALDLSPCTTRDRIFIPAVDGRWTSGGDNPRSRRVFSADTPLTCGQLGAPRAAGASFSD